MIRPPCGDWSRIARNAALAHRNMPSRLTAATRRHCSNVRSPKLVLGTLPPALLKSASSRPASACTRANRLATESGSLTSARTAIGLPPVAIPAVSSSASARRPASATVQPAPSNASAAARPTPLPAPVTTATLAIAASSPEPPHPRTRTRGGKALLGVVHLVAQHLGERGLDHLGDVRHALGVRMQRVPGRVGVQVLVDPSSGREDRVGVEEEDPRLAGIFLRQLGDDLALVVLDPRVALARQRADQQDRGVRGTLAQGCDDGVDPAHRL